MLSDKQPKNIHACAMIHQSLTPANVVAHCRQLASEGVHRSDCASTYRFPASRPGRTNKRIFPEVSGEAE